MSPRSYDAVVLGSGQGGGPLAGALARAGRRTALVERVHVGGTCVNEGCTPTKTMVASARVAYLARRAADYGVNAGEVSVDMARVRRRKQAIVDSFRGGSERRLDAAGVELLRGEARFTGPHSIEVRADGAEPIALTSELIFINTGLRSDRPPLPGLDTVPTLDSTTIMELDELPSHLLVVGGGYVGLEFAQMFRRYGSRVTVVQRAAQVLPREDRDVADEVVKILRDDGIDVLLEAQALRVERRSDGRIALTVRVDGAERALAGSHLLVATGRVPNTEELDLGAAGIEADERGYIKVNSRLETSVPGVYALGDVKGGPAFTHISYDDFRIIRTNLLEGGQGEQAGQATTDGRLVPYTVFIDPQLGGVGMTEREARRAGRNVRVAKMPMSYVARALEMSESRGFMKAIVDADTKQILGCSVLGVEGGEIMAIFQVAMMGHLPYTALRDAVFAHPTLAESLNNLFTMLDSAGLDTRASLQRETMRPVSTGGVRA